MDEEALVARAKDEREKIFQRYDKGREPGAEIDPWEDPQFEEYHKMDRYGFIHDERLPQKRDPLEVKAMESELELEKKWLKLLGNQYQPPKRPWEDRAVQVKVRKRAFKGIPEKVRGMVWRKLLKLEEVMKRGEGKYRRMLELARHWSTEARQIDKDVNRQFRDHVFYRERYSVKQKSLFNVLVAYSMYNSEVGYCQGMSGLAGVLLMYMDEEEAFWALSVLLADPKYAMHGLFIEGFPKLNRFLAHHDKIITKFIPKLKKHFDRCNLDSILYSLKWFFVVFIERIPFSLCLRVWDIYLLDGEKVVTAMAYNILRMHKAFLIKLLDMDQIVQYIQTRLCQDFGYDNDTVVKSLEHCMEKLRKAGLELPAPPGEIELPKKPFGVFVEPTTAAQIGRRKQEFTETEKDVTETVKLKREITEQEIANLDRITVAPGGSAQQLNTVHIPESEDGGSLLGSSRKSLADTSVTSTADLSVVSGGQSQRSHQPFDFCVDDQKVIPSEDEDDGESSPVFERTRPAEPSGRAGRGACTSDPSTARPAELGSTTSAIGSTSVVERSTSALQLMTPRAMSPHDVVRIYVPPAPPEEMHSFTHHSKQEEGVHERVSGTVNGAQQQGRDRSSRGSTFNDDGGEDEEVRTRRNSEIDLYLQQSADGVLDGASGVGGPAPFWNGVASNGTEMPPTPTTTATSMVYGSGRFSDFASGEFNGSAMAPPTGQPTHYSSTGRSTSSSRRGSMSRKSPAPMLDSEFIIECSHVKNRKYVPDHHSSHNSLVLGIGSGERRPGPATGTGTTASRNGSESNIQRMTSFEELAKAAKLHHLSGGGSGSIVPAQSGSSSCLVRNASEDCYAVRPNASAQTNTRMMAHSEMIEPIDSREDGYEGSLRRQGRHYAEKERYDNRPAGTMLVFTPIATASMKSRKSSRGHKSDYSIHYRNLSPKTGGGGGGPASPQSDGGGDGTTGGSEWSSGVEYRALKASSSRQNSGNDSSPIDYDPLPSGVGTGAAPSKQYNRFFNNDEDEGEEEEEEEVVRDREEHARGGVGGAKTRPTYSPHRDDEDKLLLGKHSSDDSSTSPPLSGMVGADGRSARPSQLPQYHHRHDGGYGSQQRQRPRQRLPEHHHQNGSTPTHEMVPLLPASPPGSLATASLDRGRSGPAGKILHAPPISSSSIPRGQQDGVTSPTYSSIPVSSNSRRKQSSTETSSQPSGSVSGSGTPTGSTDRRRPSNAHTNNKHQPLPVSPPTGQSRIPVSGLKSPTSPTSSFRENQHHRTRIPTSSSNSVGRGEGQPISPPATYQRVRSPPSGDGGGDTERLPQYRYGASSGSTSLTLSPSLQRHAPSGLPVSAPDASSRLASSRSAHQIQSDTNRIRIQINPSPSYTGKSGG